MDTLDRGAQLADTLDEYIEKGSSTSPNLPTPPNTISPSPYGAYAIPATMTQAPDSQRQFYKQGGAGQYRFFNNIPIAANQSSASSQNQAQQYARWQSTNLTLSQIADSPQFSKVPIEQFDANGNLIVVNFQGAWDSTVSYSDGQEVSYNGNVWVATSTNTNSTPSAGNPFWELVGPQTLDNVANGVLYGKVTVDAIDPSGNVDLAGTGWVNKTIDHLPDGSNYARTLGNLLYQGTLKSQHASTIAQTNPSHWYIAEGLSGNFPLTDIGTSPVNLTLVSLGGGQGISQFSLVNGDALLGAFLGNYSAYYFHAAGYGGSFTFSTWAYFNGANPPTNATLMSMGGGPPTGNPGSSEAGLFVDVNGAVSYFGAFTGGNVTITSAALNWTVPHHIVVTVVGAQATMIIDGHIIVQGSTTGTHDSFQYVILGAAWNGSAWVGSANTTFQHIAMWDGVALSLGQIQALYQAGASGVQSLDNLPDGSTWQRVTGVTSNKTNTSSYTPGSVSINVQTINAAGTSVTAPLGSPQTVETITMPASASGAALISLSTNNQASSGIATGITFYIYNGSTLLYETGVSTKDVSGTILGNVFAGVSGLLDTTVTGGTVYTVKAAINDPSSSISCTNILFSVLNIKS